MTPEKLREFIPESWLGITEPLSAEQQKDLETYYRHMHHTVEIDTPRRRIYRDDETEFEKPRAEYQRHTVDIDRQGMQFEDDTPQLRFSGFALAWVLVVGIAVGCFIGRWWVAHGLGGCHGG